MQDQSFKQVVDKIRIEINIGDVAYRLGIAIQKKGNQKKALCPFHKDIHPSLMIKDDSIPKHYHCFACNAHGDVFSLVMGVNHLSFKEAFDWICKEYNYSVKKRNNIEFKKWQNPFDYAYDLAKSTSDIKSLSDWCISRKINKSVLNNAGVLYLNRNALFAKKRNIENHGFRRDEIGLLEDAGFLKWQSNKVEDNNSKTFLDLGSEIKEVFWYKHVLFPIRDINGRITGFAAREAENDPECHVPKYRYTKGFKRSENLFRIDRVFEQARKYVKEVKNSNSSILDQKFELFIVEGFMDALRLESFGKNAVAILGSSISGNANGNEPEGQWGLFHELSKLLNGIALHIHLFLDNDYAGKKGVYNAIPKFINLRHQVWSNLYLDVIEFELRAKDPDEIFKSEREEDFLVKSSRSVVDFFASRFIDIECFEIESKFKDLTGIQKSQLFSLLKSKVNIEETYLFENTFGKKGFIKPETFPKPDRIKDDSISEKLTDDPEINSKIQKAIQQCEAAYDGIEFPIDYKSWERLQKAGALLIDEFDQKILKVNNKEIEPYIGVLTPREDNGDPRLKVLPSPEVLVMQEYVLNCILQHASNNLIPEKAAEYAVFYDDNIVSLDNDFKRKSVSFSYQVNKNCFHNNSRNGITLFRHFSKCWDDFNFYILDRVRKAPSNDFVLHPARLDIRRYYDSIPQYAIRNIIEKLLKNSFDNGLILPGLNSSQQAVQWILNVSFGYKYYLPNGQETQWHTLDTGIPQGPNLSAWLANILLFKVDEVMSSAVEKINENHNKNGNIENIVSTYARYVDDIVLIAPSAEDLNELTHLFSSEIAKLSLMLSPKTDPMEPYSRDDMETWLLKNRPRQKNLWVHSGNGRFPSL